ncbi:chromate resistance protein ChrB domain-containing protein [Gluconacetobacter tumulicola]|uniref:ChrB protein n=1 Tax=Gluconacetobacter tumulicola TaxID=1017177 RepID=A0A7W4JCX7_9PROT|nr:chromate resistance protein ChrB domain-containing protein [Gluconacetobacter tumulicola]MBB2178943.1 ChrB protein [Gluconacetobacter tumulicola]
MSVESSRTGQPWLLLIHQLPPKPAYFRVKIWRRLQGIGAVAVKSTVYALPAGAETQEDLEWLLKEIVEGGGEAMMCEARLIDGLSDAQVRALFDAARNADYDAIADEARELGRALDADRSEDKRAEIHTQLRRLRKRVAAVARIDFFGAGGRDVLEAVLDRLEARATENDGEAGASDTARASVRRALQGRVWVTRQDVHVDRIACAWLIRRFIDPAATIRFVPSKGYEPKKGELRFDMFAGEFTHEGDQCSFEVLLARAGLTDPALRTIGEIIHDIDLKDGKFGREEATGIAHLISGVAMANQGDEQRTALGGAIFENLYSYFRAQPE